MVGCRTETPEIYLLAVCFVGNCFEVMRCETFFWKKKGELFDDCGNCVCFQILDTYL